MTPPNLPTLTHLQFFVLTALVDAERSGLQLRELLEWAGEKKSGPAFYQMMARIEEAKYVKGRYSQKIIDGQIIRERHYKLLAAGKAARNQSLDFYRGTR